MAFEDPPSGFVVGEDRRDWVLYRRRGGPTLHKSRAEAVAQAWREHVEICGPLDRRADLRRRLIEAGVIASTTAATPAAGDKADR